MARWGVCAFCDRDDVPLKEWISRSKKTSWVCESYNPVSNFCRPCDEAEFGKPPEGPCSVCGSVTSLKSWHKSRAKNWSIVCSSFSAETGECDDGKGKGKGKGGGKDKIKGTGFEEETITVAVSVLPSFVNLTYRFGERIDNDSMIKKLVKEINIEPTNLYSAHVSFGNSMASSSASSCHPRSPPRPRSRSARRGV